MRELIKQKLLEAIKTYHWKTDSYPIRILDGTFHELGPEVKNIVDDKIKTLESLEFDNGNDKIGVWLYMAPVEIEHPPYGERDRGTLLLAILNGNRMTTLYWKHKREGDYDISITIDDLVKLSKSEFYHPTDKPINIKNILAWRKSLKEPKEKRETFKKVNLTNDSQVKYYQGSNKFETLDSQPINIKYVFPHLPNDGMMINVFSKANDDEKLELIELIPTHLSSDFENLLEVFRKK